MPLQPPPISTHFISSDAAFEALQSHARIEGYALVKTRPSNYQNGRPRRYDIACVCGNREFKSASSGLRKTTTKRTGCPFKMKIVQRKELSDFWVAGILCSDHNHDFNNPISFPEHRRNALTKGQHDTVTALIAQTSLTARAIKQTAQVQYPDLLLTEKDISNMRRGVNDETNEGRTSTQATIAALREEGIYHQVKLDKEDRLEYLLVLVDHGLELWHRFSNIMMLDVTYNTNRFNLKLLEVNGITCLGTVFPLAFILSPREDTDLFSWSLRMLKDILHHNAPQLGQGEDSLDPFVVITDFDAAAKAGLRAAFPQCQQQLCTWHISKNVGTGVKTKWKVGRDEIFAFLEEEDTHPQHQQQKDFLKAWSGLQHAATEEEFNSKWEQLQLDYQQQQDLLSYVNKTYIVVRQQWAEAFTKRYRNFGHTTTSPCEAQHSSSRTFIRNGSCTIYDLVKALLQQRQVALSNYEAQAGREARRNRDSYRFGLYNNVVEKVSHRSLRIVQEQYNLAKSALLNPSERGLGQCSGLFSLQFGLPCRHIISDYLKLEEEGSSREVLPKRPLELALWDTQWLLREDLVETDPLRRIRDPRITPRRQRPENKKIPLPEAPRETPRETPRQQQPQQQRTPSEIPSEASQGAARPRMPSQKRKSTEEVLREALMDFMPSLLQEALVTLPLGSLITNTAAQRAITPQTTPVILQEAVFPRTNVQSHTIHRSAADQLSLKRIPSQFEAFEPPRATGTGPRSGYVDRPRFFEQPGLRPPISNSLAFVEGGHPGPGSLTSTPQGSLEVPFRHQIPIQITNNIGQSRGQSQQPQQQRLGSVGSLQPYERCLQF